VPIGKTPRSSDGRFEHIDYIGGQQSRDWWLLDCALPKKTFGTKMVSST